MQGFSELFFRWSKHQKSPLFMRLINSAFRQFVLVQPQIMPQLVQKSCSYLFPKNQLVSARKSPEVVQKQNNLRRQRNVAFFGKFRPRKQSHCVRLNPLRLQFQVWPALKHHRQLFHPRPQRFGQCRNRRPDLLRRDRTQFFPIDVHFCGPDPFRVVATPGGILIDSTKTKILIAQYA